MHCSCEREIQTAEAVNKCFLADQNHNIADSSEGFNIFRVVALRMNFAYFASAVI